MDDQQIMLKQNKTEQPNTFYVETVAGSANMVKVIRTFADGSQHVDYPIRYLNGKIGYDRPEAICKSIQEVIEKMLGG